MFQSLKGLKDKPSLAVKKRDCKAACKKHIRKVAVCCSTFCEPTKKDFQCLTMKMNVLFILHCSTGALVTVVNSAAPDEGFHCKSVLTFLKTCFKRSYWFLGAQALPD